MDRMTNAHHAQSANSWAACIVRAMGAWVGSCAVACVVNATHAETYEVKPGDDWAALGPKLVAGDEIVLLEGMHRPAQFSAIAGTRICLEGFGAGNCAGTLMWRLGSCGISAALGVRGALV